MDVDQLISPEERQRFAFALGNLHGIQQLHVASVPRGAPADVSRRRMDDCQVVYECPIYKPRA